MNDVFVDLREEYPKIDSFGAAQMEAKLYLVSIGQRTCVV